MAWSRRRAADASSASRAQGDDPELATWLNENGMPRFAGYSWRQNLPVLTNVLFVVLAFELAILPWLVRDGTQGSGLTAAHLAFAPAFLAAVALAVHVGFRNFRAWVQVGFRNFRAWAHGGFRNFHAWPIGGVLWLSLPIVGVLALVFAARQVSPGIRAQFLWVDYTVDALIVYLLLSASWRFVYSDLPARAVPPGRKRQLLLLVSASIVLIALEHTFFPTWSRAASLGGLPLPQGTVALGVALVLLVLTRSRGADHQGGGPPTRVGDRLQPAVPLLIFVLAVEAAVLPYVSSRLEQLVLPLIGLSIVLALTWATSVGPLAARLLQGGFWQPSVNWWLAAYLVSYPVLIIVLDVRLEVGGGDVWNGLQAAVFVLVVNLFYLGLGVFLAALALEKVAKWAWSEFWAGKRAIITGVLTHAPVVLVFAAFFLLTAETWEVAVEEERDHAWEFGALVGGLLATSAVLLFVDAQQSIGAARRFTAARMRTVLDAAEDTRLTPLPPDMSGRLAERMPEGTQEQVLTLSGLRRFNISIVIGAYQMLIFVPLLLFAGLVFYVLAEISVAPMVAATWIRGDGAGPTDAASLKQGTSILDYPWLRVAILLAAFALLERVVSIITEPEKRAAVLGPVDIALQVRFAAALLLDRAPDAADVAGSPLPVGNGGRQGPPASRAASVLAPASVLALLRVMPPASDRNP